MKLSIKHIFALGAISTLLFQVNFGIRRTQKITPLHFVENINGQSILSNLDRMLEDNRLNDVNSSYLQQKNPKGDSSTDLYLINPQLGNLWNNTAMLFGASADGIGIGTSFAISQPSRSTALFVTNFHVVEHFCQTPYDQVSGLITDVINGQFSTETDGRELEFKCKSLFVLHDVAINTETNQTIIDGNNPWKSEVKSLVYFDKKLDLAVFKIDLPKNFFITQTGLETDYNLKKPSFKQKKARIVQVYETELPAEPLEPTQSSAIKSPLESFELYTISYTSSSSNETLGLIKKTWSKGISDGIRAFETDDRLGIISAIKHNIEIKSGSSGSPLALSDGRVIGVNASLELNQFYANSGCSQEELETHLAFYAIPTVFLKPIIPIKDQGAFHE